MTELPTRIVVIPPTVINATVAAQTPFSGSVTVAQQITARPIQVGGDGTALAVLNSLPDLVTLFESNL